MRVGRKRVNAAARSSARCDSRSAARRGVRTRRPARRTSTPQATPTAREGCPASRRRSDPVHARRVALGSPHPVMHEHQRRRDLRSLAREAPRTPASRSARGPRTPSQPIPPRGAGQRMRASAPRPESSHCASSSTQTSGCSSATSDRRPSTARPTRKRSGASPALRPNAVPSASAWGPGRNANRSSIGAQS